MEKWNLIIYSPAYNVEKTVGELIERITEASKELEKSGISLALLLLVNDGSTDGTLQIIEGLGKKKPFLKVVSFPSNMGPTQALLRGMEEVSKYIKKNKVNPARTIVVRMDSDLEHTPEDLPALLHPILSSESGVSVGFIPFDERSGLKARQFNEKIGLMESREFLGLDIPQFCPGFNAMRGDAFLNLLPSLKNLAEDFKIRTGREMLTIDFISLVLAKRTGEKISICKLSEIEDTHLKQIPQEKLDYYSEYHRITVEFVRKRRAD